MLVFKGSIFALLFMFLLVACGEKSSSVQTADDPSTETKLINDLKKYPDSSLITETLMQYYRDVGNYDKAISLVNESLAKDSNNVYYLDIRGILQIEKGDTSGAIRSYEQAIAINPQPEYVIALGTLYAQTKNPLALEMADALQIADKAKADRPANFIKGLYYTYIGEKQKAITFFDNCIKLSFTDMDAYLEKSIAQNDMGNTAEALATIEKAVTIDNSFDAGHFYKGKYLEKLNRPKEAIEAYRMALLYDKNYMAAKDALSRLGVN